MPDSKPQKIAYLFGAGATHAELANLEKDPSAKFEETSGLLIKNVSDRVIEKARHDINYLKDIEMVSNVTGSLNIELLISLIENSRIRESGQKTSYLKDLVKKDITAILTKPKLNRFYLHRALLELHKHEKVKKKEELLGLISLNYDTVLDEAYKTIHRKSPNYFFTLNEKDQNNKLPLLKLHGSFDWDDVEIRGRTRSIEIIPMGANKNILHIPYNFIWSRAQELLIQCDILRVVGCSLSQNDIHLIDLLFKAHLERGRAFEIQIISPEDTGQQIQDNYGFFPKIKRLTEIESSLIPMGSPLNAFKVWLAYKGRRMLKETVEQTIYLKRVVA